MGSEFLRLSLLPAAVELPPAFENQLVPQVKEMMA